MADPALVRAGLRVRMEMHTGEALQTTSGHIGVAVHLAARIADAAHGGQILLSDSTAAIVRDPLL